MIKTGNDFIAEFPHHKVPDNYDKIDFIAVTRYSSLIMGALESNEFTLKLAQTAVLSENSNNSELNSQLEDFKLITYVDIMSVMQIIKIVKKYCDKNPEKTHQPFVALTLLALYDLAI
tara:strand:+ start:132 stop:485 length:354 start_codon:yes stop_codon:yes gene_type:complete